LSVARILIVLFLASAPAIADAPKKPKAEEIAQADADKYFAFFNKLADAIIANKDNCPRMASAINTIVDANQDIIKRVAEARSAGKTLPKALEEKMAARTREMIPAMNKCGGDPDVKAASRRIDAGKPSEKPPAKSK
jgi:hypothetical protein